MHPALLATDHRPWPLPRAPWRVTMDWVDLVFLHWPVAAADLQRWLPSDLTVDEFDGSAWLGIVPFRMARTRLRWLPPIPTTGAFPELNVRTYVRRGDRRGVWFFSLDAASRCAVEAARRWYRLPYLHAEMACTARGAAVEYTATRRDGRAPPARFAARWTHGGPSAPAQAGSLQHFLTERYCLFARGRDGRSRCGEIAHAPWRLMPASVDLQVCDLTRLLELELPDCAPYALMAEPQAVVAWPLA